MSVCMVGCMYVFCSTFFSWLTKQLINNDILANLNKYITTVTSVNSSKGCCCFILKLLLTEILGQSYTVKNTLLIPV